MRSIDGQTLKKMLISATNNLYNNYPEVDALNVFPVPDGDTGMNMNLTMSSGVKEIQNRNDEDVSVIISTFSRGLLMGARGNSGVITSQIFRGVAQSLKDKKSIRLPDFIDAFSNGAKIAYKAVVRPVEGTILTVIREAAQYLSDNVESDMSLERAMDMLVQEATASLKRTPELLPVLKEAGVVDSGGAGLVKILEGMQGALEGAFVERAAATSFVKEAPGAALKAPGYHVEFSLVLGPADIKKPFVEKRFRNVLYAHASEVSYTNDGRLIAVSLKTMKPGQVITYAQSFGEFENLKVEASKVAPTYTKPEIPEPGAKAEMSEYGIVAVSAGEGVAELFKEVGVSQVVDGGRTMNPSIEDIAAAIRAANAHNVYVLPDNPNVIMAASHACEVAGDEFCHAVLIPSRTIPQGIVSASAFNPDADPKANREEMENALKNVSSGFVAYAIRDARIDGIDVRKDDFLGFREKKLVVAEKERLPAFYKLIEAMVSDTSSIVTVLLGEDVPAEDGEEIAQVLREKYPDVEIDVRPGGQPVYAFIVGVE